MSDTRHTQQELLERIHRFAVAGESNEMADDLWSDFEQLLIENDDACRLYVEYMGVASLLPAVMDGWPVPDGSVPGVSAVEQPPAVLSSAFDLAGNNAQGYFSAGWPVAYLVATVVFAIGLVIGAMIHVSQPGQHADHHNRAPAPNSPAPVPNPSSIVARITGMADCVVNNDECRMQNAESQPRRTGIHHSSFITQHSLLHLGDRLALKSGLVELTYDTGARVILQGPVTYEVESPAGGYLSLGKLTARLEKKSEARGQRSELANQKSPDLCPLTSDLFAIRTPTAVVTDLGTEFGVEVDNHGQTTSYVFRGAVRFQWSGTDADKDSGTVVLHENESVSTVKSESLGGPMVAVRRVGADTRGFVRDLSRSTNTLDLLDIVAGGDGRGHRRERGIDPSSGMEDPLFVGEERHNDGKYQPVTWHKLIDGVFIPNGESGPVMLDSAGHTFDDFPKTCGLSYGSIWPRAVDVNMGKFRGVPVQWMYLVGRAEQYMPEKRGLLCLCPNTGITFNLDAIRKSYPTVRPDRFRTLAGLADAISADMQRGMEHGPAGIWVFVDGQLKLSRTQLRPKDGVVAVDVELGHHDRFLTLVSTDGGQGTAHNWIVFGDPLLDLVSVGQDRP